MKNIKIDAKTIIGAGSGVAIGFFLLKTKNPIALIALGVGGGLIASQIKTRNEKIKEVEMNSENYLDKIKEDIDETLSEDEGNSSAEGVSFNPTVGYMTPHGTIEEQNPVEFMDIGF